VEEQGTLSATSKTKRMLTDALDRVAEGLPGVESSSVQIPSYPGLLNIWDYARDVRRALLASLDMAVKDAEDEARIIATAGVQQVLAIGEEHLPAGVERSRRVFMPEAMFSTHRMRNGKRKIRQDSIVVAGGMLGLGIGLATRPEMIQPTFFDLLDVPHHFWVYCGDGKENSEDESGPSALSIMSVGIGVVTMIGGQAIGIRAFVESAVRIADVLSHENARSWAAPAFGAIVMGATAYFVLELPSSVPRTVGRRIRNSLIKPELGTQEEPLFVDAQAARVARETRKVLRLAAWDLKERLRVATEERSREVRGAEDMERRAVRAKEWFATVGKRTADIREQTGMVTLS
jgi:mitofusin 2